VPTFHQILTLARVPNIPTVWSNVLMAWTLAGGTGWPGLSAALIGGTLLYAGGCTLNDACDARWDRAHKPDRLIPSGAMSELAVWTLGLMEMGSGLLLMILANPRTWFLPFGLALAILAYDFRHKETPWSVIVMGACRALLVLAAAGAAGAWFDVRVMTAAGVVWCYIIGLSLLARRESRPGGGLLRALRPQWSVGRWVGEILAAIPLVDAALLFAKGTGQACLACVMQGTGGAQGMALICLLLWPLCRLLQQKYAAT
jgi:4-hydroxybenzoate polyprenyltransferase